jgi:H+/Cl- antiporter ClcA
LDAPSPSAPDAGPPRNPTRYRTAAEREESRIGFLTLIAAGIGFSAGFIADALYRLIGIFTELFFFGRLDLNSTVATALPQNNQLGLLVVLVPAVGGILAGLMIRFGSTKIIGHGIPEAMEAILLNRSKIEPRVGILKAVSAAVTIGSGQPFGAEGPIIQTGGAFGSFVGQRIRMTGAERKILLSCGAAAGMAATFGTPIAAILLVIELLLFEFRVKSLVPVGVASAIGAWMHIYLISPQPLFQTPAFDFGGLNTLPFYVLLGLLSGILGTALSRGLYKTEDVFARLKLGQPWLPAVGGLAVGVIALLVPQILGVGYNVITDVLDGRVALTLVLLIMTAKAVAWLLAMGSQTSGGTLAPLFLVGDSLGFVVGSLLLAAAPTLGIAPGAFAVAGMAAVFGTASRAPFTSIVFALEVTKDYQGVLPVIITVVIAELVGERLMKDSIMTEKLARRGLTVRHIYDYNPLRQIKVASLMTSPLVSADASMPVVELFRAMGSPGNDFSHRKRLGVLEEGRVVGVVDREKVFEAAATADPSKTVGSICSSDFETVREDESGYQAMRLMTLHDLRFMVVVDAAGRPSGYVSRSDILKASRAKIQDESLIE